MNNYKRLDDQNKTDEKQEVEILILSKFIFTVVFYKSIFEQSSTQIKLYPDTIQEECIPLNSIIETKCNDLLIKLSNILDIVPPKFFSQKPSDTTCFDIAINKILKFGLSEWEYVANIDSNTLSSYLHKVEIQETKFENIELVTSTEGLKFKVYSSGDSQNDTVLFVPPCGVPIEAFSFLIEFLSEKFMVITWENPFLFYKDDNTNYWSLDSDIKCIEAILERYNISKVHLIGVCGGAPIAIMAAACLKDKVCSTSICHGDLYFGKGTPMTPFKEQFLNFTSMATENDRKAKEIYDMLLDPALLFGVPERLAPYIIYPYISFEVFLRYSMINSALMTMDITKAINEVTSSVFIITSENDRMAHPKVSTILHEKLYNSILWVRNKGSHYDALMGDKEIYERILRFITEGH